MSKKIRVAIIDDSAFMRKAIENMLKDEEDIEIVAQGVNGLDAVKIAATQKPDVMTLDVEMPQMDGITALQKIMKDSPMPIIMLSSLTQEGADTTLKALDLGAVDFIPKEKSSFGSMGVMKMANNLKDKIRHFAGSKGIVKRVTTSAAPRVVGAAPAPADKQTKMVSAKAHKKVVALGTSTGGPQSLQKVIPLLPADLGVPVVIVQHMPANFTASLAARLDALSQVKVVEAQGGEKLQPNVVYIAKGGLQLFVKKMGADKVIELKPEDPNQLHNPSVDVMAASVGEAYGTETLGVIMTGMGSDGKKGLTVVKQKGGMIISQNEASSIVYGMPKAVVDAGLADEIVPLEEIAARIAFHTKG
jgi:two-component system chemotaxis response regulator CheB